jgi:hypothetical protein
VHLSRTTGINFESNISCVTRVLSRRLGKSPAIDVTLASMLRHGVANIQGRMPQTPLDRHDGNALRKFINASHGTEHPGRLNTPPVLDIHVSSNTNAAGLPASREKKTCFKRFDSRAESRSRHQLDLDTELERLLLT